jgi:MFS transporter, SHS family, lactate transporter
MDKQQPWWKEPTRKQWAAFTAAWVGWVLDAFDFMVYVLVMRQLAKEFGVGLAAVSGSITLTLLMRLAGGAIAGWMADRWGRKLPLIIALVWFVSMDAAIYFSHSFTAILIFRTLFGFGMGAQWTAGTALAMESLPERTRKIGSGLLQAGWPIGVMLAALAAYFIVDANTWRPMFLVGIIPAVLTIPLWFMFPSTKPAPRIAGTKRVSPVRALVTTPGVPKMLALGSLVMALGFMVYYGLQSLYVPMLLGELHKSWDAAMGHVILFNAGMLFGVIAAGFVAQRFGVVVALVAPALLMVPALPLYVGMVPWALPIGAVLGGALGVGYSGVTPVLTTSLFPAHVRALAIGIVYHVGAGVAAFVPWLIPQVATHFHMKLSTVLGLVVGAALVLMSTAVLLLRKIITLPADARPAERVSAFDVDTAPVSTPNLRPSQAPLPVATVVRDDAKPATASVRP